MGKSKRPRLQQSLAKLLQRKAVSDAAATKPQEKKRPRTPQRPWKGKFLFTLTDTILLVGEGKYCKPSEQLSGIRTFYYAAHGATGSDALVHATSTADILFYSAIDFAHAVAKVLGSGHHIVATAYDTEKTVLAKYGNDAQVHIDGLRDLGGQVLFGIDATNLQASKPLRTRRFSHIIFNFPHTGAGIKDQNRNVRDNQLLIAGFIQSAADFLTDPTAFPETDNAAGQIQIVTKTGAPYDLWKVKFLGNSSRIVRWEKSYPFVPNLYPGYEHRRTLGLKEGVSSTRNKEILQHAPKTFVFVKAMHASSPPTKQGKPTGVRSKDSDSDSD
ncbi:hypothetical protein H4R34_002140 [Dimargaris verticillata]|uniref:25S rRNA (uridine-N(3))-methyltransferase BMT5-like domain-containing protein n=1 Tax=Dimargaris verticillata TaxID=2761393 RepID=A0A9W8B8M1_9FUNG|nr:hypothetical protein H4R34_002140 [Dimargaris verticillata]